MVKKVFINKIKNSSLLDQISENAVLEKVHLYHINLCIYIYLYKKTCIQRYTIS